MIRVERRAYVPIALTIAAPIIAAAAALVLAAVPLMLSGVSLTRMVALTLVALFTGIGDTIERATPLMLTGLAAALALRSGFVNLGVEGQMIAAAFAALAISAGVLPFPALAVLPFVLIVGMIAGALVAILVAVLKLKLRADEGIVTILLNVVLLFALQLSAGAPLQSFPPIGSLQALPLANAVDLANWGHALRAYLEPLLAIAACVLAFVLVHLTIWGLDIRATGSNVFAAHFVGVRVEFVTVGVAFLSGALAGLAGAGEVIDSAPAATPTLVLGFGYAGLAVAYLAALEPLGVIPAALFVSIVIGGIEAANHDIGVPRAFAGVVVALLLVAGSLAHHAVRYRLRLSAASEAA